MSAFPTPAARKNRKSSGRPAGPPAGMRSTPRGRTPQSHLRCVCVRKQALTQWGGGTELRLSTQIRRERKIRRKRKLFQISKIFLFGMGSDCTVRTLLHHPHSQQPSQMDLIQVSPHPRKWKRGMRAWVVGFIKEPRQNLR